jgi:hypothetical protein
MTDLEKTVNRRTCFPFAHYCKHIIVILEPGDCVAMRLRPEQVQELAGGAL